MSIVTINDKNLQDIGNAIRNKTGETKKYKPNEMAEAIEMIKGEEIKLQEKAVSPKTTAQTIVPDEGYDGMEKVNVGAVTSNIDNNIISENIKKGVSILGVNGTLEEGIKPSGELPITENGTYDVTNYASAVVEVAGGGGSIGGKYAPKFISFYNYKGTELNYEVANIDTSKIEDFNLMFYNCVNITKLDLSGFTGESATSTTSMFIYCTSLAEIDLRNFNPTKLTRMGSMFESCKVLQKLDIRSWDVSKTNNTITAKTNVFKYVPVDCEIICKHQDAVYFIRSLNSSLTNVKTLAQYQAEGGV